MGEITLLVVANPAAAFLARLARLPDTTRIVTGNQLEIFHNAAPEAGALLNCFAPVETVRAVWNMAPRLRWIHSLSAGIENTLFPELVASPVPLTNSRGVFSRPLAEFALAAALFFAKDLRRMVGSQAAARWDPFDVEELHGKVLGIVAYGSIGQEAARLARAFGMRVTAVRRRPDLSAGDPLLAGVYGPDQLRDMLAQSDFVLVAAPLTAATRALIGEAELRSMKPLAVLINIGRGPVVVEEALVRALQQGWIRGAALDVFDEEPLPPGHPFYALENVLLSPHCADHTPGWVEAAMDFFLENFQRFQRGEPLLNVVDKQSGY